MMKEWWAGVQIRRRESKNEKAMGNIIHYTNKFWCVADAKEALLTILVHRCSTEELYRISNICGQAADKKVRLKNG